MIDIRLWSRRNIIGATIGIAGLAGDQARAQEAGLPSDRGIGGTGVAPVDPEGSDRGIGGTGVVGTIRRFGSIVVNHHRITFPRSVAVRIDGRPARLADLKIGHVVHVVAEPDGTHLATRLIEVFSAVVGPIEAINPDGFTVLGQTVIVPDAKRLAQWRRHRWVAVSGLRRLDGVIVASLVERRDRGAVQVIGTPQVDPDGAMRIGSLPIDGLPVTASGQPVRLVGHRSDSRLVVQQALAPLMELLARRPERLSIEAYVALDQSGTPVDFGGALGNSGSPDRSTEETRAVVSATLRGDGQIHVDGVRVEDSNRERASSASSRSGRPGPGGLRGSDVSASAPESHAPGPMGPADRGGFGAGPGFGGGPGGRGGGPGGGGPGGAHR